MTPVQKKYHGPTQTGAAAPADEDAYSQQLPYPGGDRNQALHHPSLGVSLHRHLPHGGIRDQEEE